jgi:hypothetical protein
LESVLHFSELDYDQITEGGRLAAPSGGLTFPEFRTIMKYQV